jgi:hypothetical protein
MRRFTFTGPLAWWMGRSYHLAMIPGLARKDRDVSDSLGTLSKCANGTLCVKWVFWGASG